MHVYGPHTIGRNVIVLSSKFSACPSCRRQESGDSNFPHYISKPVQHQFQFCVKFSSLLSSFFLSFLEVYFSLPLFVAYGCSLSPNKIILLSKTQFYFFEREREKEDFDVLFI